MVEEVRYTSTAVRDGDLWRVQSVDYPAAMSLVTRLGDAAEHQRAVRDKRAAADEWQERAMENVRQGRDDLAREALTRGQECSEAADVAAAEADALDAVRDAYRNALTAVRATVADRASA